MAVAYYKNVGSHLRKYVVGVGGLLSPFFVLDEPQSRTSSPPPTPPHPTPGLA